MAQRARHEAKWTHSEAIVRGRPGGNRGWWTLGLLFAVVAVVATVAYNRYWDVQDVTFELRRCEAPLTADSTWQEVQAAACDPATIEGDEVTMWHEGTQTQADSTTGSSWTFEDIRINTVINAMEMRTGTPAESVVLAEPENETIRRALTTDSERVRWSANVGSQGPTTYWVLVTPQD
ncbi:hypothetical protein [Ornithinimicrobium pekingense]|uniref:DUF4333 domain-containing protein n=1 Tax=Ornithinimicrobium pekingense TaxID=384677 RepID=A0ABQ2FBP3_9MICO|nr:hypothetical protein [Ornithinimicrobium pekingense]GGK78043.1 hypothetical protein GCM10011509_28210 [Ornithinimicrobium pekingense]